MTRRWNWLAAATLIVACSTGPQPASNERGTSGPKPATLDDVSAVEEGETPSMAVTLKEAKGTADESEQSKAVDYRADPKPLDDAAAESLLSRMPALQTTEDDRKKFATSEKSKPPPRTGDETVETFPPGDETSKERPDADSESEPLEVVRVQPTGEVETVPRVSVTFNHPMVEVTSHAEASRDVPVELEPEPEGTWQWIGTKTVVFEPAAERFPKSSSFEINVPAAATSANGEKLGEAVTETFETPALSIAKQWPTGDSEGLRPPIFIQFDQRIDRNAIAEHLEVAPWNAERPVDVKRIGREKALELEPYLERGIDNAPERTWIAVRPIEDLPTDSRVYVSVAEDALSAEGPKRTRSRQQFSFRTYGPLKVEDTSCARRNCQPTSAFYFQFTNELDEENFDVSSIEIEPAIEDRTIEIRNNAMAIRGTKRGRRTYEVTLPKSLVDEFGQKLSGERTFEFDVGVSEASLGSAAGEMVVPDPASPASLSVHTINYGELRVKVYDVSPSDWSDYSEYHRKTSPFRDESPEPPGERVRSEVIEVDGALEERVETTIDLEDVLGPEERGNAVVVVEPASRLSGAPAPRYGRTVRTWVQSTEIGLDAFVDRSRLLAWATDLQTGDALEGAKVTIGAGSAEGETNASGIARLQLPEKDPSDGAPRVRVSHGGDSAFLPDVTSGFGGGRHAGSSLVRAEPQRSVAWYVFDDRGMYRPGETVRVKGWIRSRVQKRRGGLEFAEAVEEVEWKVLGPRNNEIDSGAVTPSRLGGFDLSFDVPKDTNLGTARVALVAEGGEFDSRSASHAFEIQEFQKPKYEVNLERPEGPHFAGSSVEVGATASYYAGGPLPNAEVDWSVTTQPGDFTPPNQSDFEFGRSQIWWFPSPNKSDAEEQTFTGRTDASGMHRVSLDLGDVEPPLPMSVSIEASVTDVDRQTITETSEMLVHPGSRYVGLRTDRYFVGEGEPLEVEAIVADIDGTRHGDRPVEMRASRVEQDWKNGEYQEKLVDTVSCKVVTKKEPVTCTFEPSTGGRYRIQATTVDDQGRRHYTEITRWVAGGDAQTARNVEQEDIGLVPNRRTFEPGETAELMVRSPVVPAEALLTLRRNGVVERRRFRMEEATKTIEVAIEKGYVPNITVQVDVVGAETRENADGEPDESLPKRPGYGSGKITLEVPPTHRRLSVEVSPERDEVAPGGSTSVDVQVTTADDEPAEGAEVAIVAVDEAVLALSEYELPDPLDVFHPSADEGVRDYHLRSKVQLAAPEELRSSQNRETGARRAMEQAASGSVGSRPSTLDATANMAPAEPGAEDSGIAMRSDFSSLARFAPDETTDADGKVSVDVDLPDNLTRYRLMAVAVDGARQFGSAEDAVTARLPVMVRPSLPRFLNFGDEAQMPVVVHNQTGGDATIDVAMRTANLSMHGPKGYEVDVPADQRAEVRFPVATERAGTARLQVAATATSGSDSVEKSLPVWTPSTSEAFATYGTIDEGTDAMAVSAPKDVWPQFGGLEINTSSTALQSLTDAFLYLYEYEYRCTEQIASRMLSVAALRDVLEAFDAEGMPAPEKVESSMQSDIETLAGRQRGDGGFGLWPNSDRTDPFVTIHAAQALARAESKGYDISEVRKPYLERILEQIERVIPSSYPTWTRRFLRAYALYVRDLMGDGAPSEARALLDEVDDLDALPFETLGWLLHVMSGDAESSDAIDRLHKYLGNRVQEQSGTAHFAARYDESDQGYLIMQSDRRADATILEALMEDRPKSDLIPKVVRGLLAGRKKGRWSNTQENAFVLLALDRYFRQYEEQSPDFVARVWLGEDYAGEHAFEGRTTERHRIDVPMKQLSESTGGEGKSTKLYLQKDGKGRMYYRVGLDYAPRDLDLDPADHGFAVERTYEAIEEDDDVRRRDDGTWVVEAGAKVRVRLKMVAPTRRYHVALKDPLPAGFEPMNPALATTGSLPDDPDANDNPYWWWSRPWYEHQNMRDDRVEAFASLVWGGVHEYTYYAKATTPGTFVAPPTKAEEMYHPETFGRTGTATVVVKESP